MSTALPTIELLGFPVHAITELACAQHVVDCAARRRGGWVATPNLDHLRRLVSDPEFRALCVRADLRVADGMPLLWAAALQGTPLPERVSGSNLIWSVCEAAAARGLSVFLLGGDPGTAEGAARVLQALFSSLRVAGTCCPQPGFERDPQQLLALVETLKLASPDIVFVALGSPKQERLIGDLQARFPSVWWLGVGISFSFVTGAVKRAPRWMQRLGLEWVHRLAQEPGRLFRRYLIDGIPFVALLLLSSARRGLATKRRPG